ncbi:MAG: beta-lactamase family protein [Actinomycetota bacterium]|nr:beta-lactamase family protein [Actinomycetota bacterium]
MSTEGLEAGMARLRRVMADQVERGAMPGLIALVAHQHRAHIEVAGTLDFGDATPMPQDAVFRIASLTKPIIAAAVMILVDDGTLRLGAPVDDLIPELANRRVLTSLDAKIDDTVPARRPITVEDLLTFRLGFGCIMAPPDTYPIQTAVENLHLATLGPPWPPTPHTPDEWMARLATLPLMEQPGERWRYNSGAHILGVLVARAAGKPLEAFLRERLFDPLGMPDTGFSVQPGQPDRMTTAYSPDPESGALTVLDGVDNSHWSRPPAFPDAGGGLLSTIDDYWAFVQMMVNRGLHHGRRLLSETSVQLMTTNHLTPEQRAASALFLGDGGWGYLMAAPTARSSVPRGFGWDGGTGTTWRSDVDNDLTGILFTQRAATSPQPAQVLLDFWSCVYQAIGA